MDINKFIVTEDVSIFEAASLIDQNGRQLVFVCREKKLVASLSDGDIRRHILRRGDFSLPVREIANYQPKYLYRDQQAKAKSVLRRHDLKAIPILNAAGEVVAIEFENSLRVKRPVQLALPVVIMAGGKGSRLAPYTNVLPKPLIPIGEKTITEHIIDRFLGVGCSPVYLIVNYKKELIKAFFKESPYADKVTFVDEEIFLGTGGGLQLLEGKVAETFFMTNCDILLDADYEDIYRHHRQGGYVITMVCAMKKVSIPYGTVELDEKGNPVSLAEKPEYSMLTNTGFYVIEPDFLQHLPPGTAVGITDIIQKLIREGGSVGVYPVSESAWMDMGQFGALEDMQRTLDERGDLS